MARVAIEKVCHSYGELDVLQDIELTLETGAFVAVIGPSGCGKSTLLRMLAGLVEPSSGSLSINGVDVAGTPGHVGYLPQGDSLLPWKRALDNATLGLRVEGVPKAVADKRAHELFSVFGLQGFEQAWPYELSGGMRQRVAVLRTFLLPHEVLGLDEPFGALDALTRRSLQAWLRSMWMEDKRTTVLITHDVEEALLLADRVVVMTNRPGRIAASISVEGLDERGLGVETSDQFVALKRNVLDALSGQMAAV